MNENVNITQKLNYLVNLITDQTILKKEVLNFRETCRYLDISASHLYKLTSQKLIPHFCPQGKRLYFNRLELDTWLQRNRQTSADEIENKASNYIISKDK